MIGITPHQACFYAHELTRLGAVGDLDRLSTTLFDSRVDLNPHQIDAALFAIANPLLKGVLLADEVGLGKTIEAGLVLCQKWAERKRKLIVVCPAHIRKQWQNELNEKFNLPAIVIDRRAWNLLRAEGHPEPFDCGKIAIVSYGFAARMKDDLRAIPFDLVVFDEAHKLRNAYQPSRKGGQAVRWAFELRQKILLTATPLQNSLLELYGLAWLIDDQLFGNKGNFQARYCTAGGDLVGLRNRLSHFCKRTLRKECAYINYTKRQAVAHRFAQTDEEKQLHRDVLDFMSREISFAFPYRQRQLIEMILFKTLASSPQALASTLETMRQRLIAIRDGLKQPEDDFLDEISLDEDFDVDALAEQIDLEGIGDDPIRPALQGQLIAEELSQIESLIARARRITTDSKSKALLTALDAAFKRLEELGARRKALIFTESRKTQEFLAQYLEANGYKGKVVTFNGSNSHPSAKQAYERYIKRHAGSDRLTGSKVVDMRSALIEEFEHHAEILLATEAAAEGVNLQFCSLVVNYDLPWNPQRIEQRIGRCHRYGQKFDVIVVNFLSQDNIADCRVHDLLQQKFSLFDGLFGASDEVLGAIEDGIDFEKRVISILKTCRTDQQIAEAFDQLQRELEGVISQRMLKAREQLFEHFDADVHERLRIKRDDAQLALDRVGQRFWRLAEWGLRGHAEFDTETYSLCLASPPAPDIPAGRYRLISTVRADDHDAAGDVHLLRLSSPLGQWLLERGKSQSLPIAKLRFDISNHSRRVFMLKPLIGKSGWLRLDKLMLDTDTREEFLCFTAITDEGENLDHREQVPHLMDVAASVVENEVTIAEHIADRLGRDADRLLQSRLIEATERSNVRFKQVQEQINQWAEDRIKGAELELETIRRDLKAARREADLAETVQTQQAAQERIAQLERHQRRQRAAIFEVEDEIEVKRKKLIDDLRQRISAKSQVEMLFLCRWECT